MSTDTSRKPADESKRLPPDLSELWQFSGHGLKSSEFTTAMVHFYRGEITRANTWRNRLDITTNWAIITSAAMLSFVFGAPGISPTVLIINTLLVLFFLFIEARRYRYYELWASRVRILETNFLAGLLSPPFVPQAGWADQLTESLRRPRFPITLGEAFGRRFRRNYAPLFLVLALSYLIKLFIHPEMTASVPVALARAAIGPLPGWLVLGFGLVANAAIFIYGIYSTALREATGEVLGDEPLTRWQTFGRYLRSAMAEAFETDINLRALVTRERRKNLAYIISDEIDRLGPALLEQLGRGVTLLHGTGMYTGDPHGVLMVVVGAGQSERLKKLVYQYDPRAFVIITATQDVRGSGFRPLEA